MSAQAASRTDAAFALEVGDRRNQPFVGYIDAVQSGQLAQIEA